MTRNELYVFTNPPPPKPLRWPIIDSSSSMKIVEGAWNLANSNKTYKYYSPVKAVIHNYGAYLGGDGPPKIDY